MFLQCLRKVAKFVTEQNDRVYMPRGLVLTSPVDRGLRVVSFLSILLLIVCDLLSHDPCCMLKVL